MLEEFLYKFENQIAHKQLIFIQKEKVPLLKEHSTLSVAAHFQFEKMAKLSLLCVCGLCIFCSLAQSNPGNSISFVSTMHEAEKCQNLEHTKK